MIQIDISGNQAVLRQQPVLVAGTVGQKVRFHWDDSWKDLTKTAVFRCGDITRDVINVEETATIPYEVLTLPGLRLHIGVYGANRGGTVAIPTVWATTDPVQPGAEPVDDPGLQPEDPAWQQALSRIGDIDTALDGILAIQNSLIGGDMQ